MTSENVAAKYGIAREVQDKMAVSSHQRAAKARDTGRFKEEIVPVKTIWKDPKTGIPCKQCIVNQAILQNVVTVLQLMHLSAHLGLHTNPA